MIRIATAAAILAIASHGAPAAEPDAAMACKEAMAETLTPNTRQKFRNAVYIACMAAFADTRHRQSPWAACARQADALGDDYAYAVADTCMRAMTLLYGRQ